MSNRDRKNQTLAGRQFDAVASVTNGFVEQADRFFAQTREFQTILLRNQSVWFSKVIFARSVSEVVEAQKEHAKAQYEASVGGAKKIAQLLTDFARGAGSSSSAAAPQATAAPVKPYSKPVAVRIERDAA
jgi:hypothetical protein